MGVLTKTKTYLIGPMQYVSDGMSWRDDMTEFLNKMGIVVFDPYHKPFINAKEEDNETRHYLRSLMDAGRFNEVHWHMKEVRSFDLAAVDKSDFIIAFIDPSIPTFGTMEELAWAVRCKKPCFVVVDGGREQTPFWLMGMMPPRFFYNSFSSLKNMLMKIDNEEIEIDNERWRLLKPELR